MEKSEKQILENIIQIRNNQRITKRLMAEKMNLNEASYGRIESGAIALSYTYLARIASIFEMSVIDVISYPDKYVKANKDAEDPMEAVLQIKLKKDKRDQVMKLVFGDNDIEILNK